MSGPFRSVLGTPSMRGSPPGTQLGTSPRVVTLNTEWTPHLLIRQESLNGPCVQTILREYLIEGRKGVPSLWVNPFNLANPALGPSQEAASHP